jgi:uncharacterized protein
MSIEDLSFTSDQFCGTARLFPLPNLVMFPHVIQPLHIFEQRYRDMLEEALENDRLIAMSVLRAGWESDYDGRPPVHSTACLCRVATHYRTEQGTYNALLLGLRRIKIVRELPALKRFREAKAMIVEDEYPEENAKRRQQLQRRLVGTFRKVLPKLPPDQEPIEHLLAKEVPLGMLTDVISYMLDLDQKIKEDLLRQPLPDLRALLLLECLRAAAKKSATKPPVSRVFPPEFSLN